MTIRLLLADDQALVRGALAALLDLESDLRWWHRSGGATRWWRPRSRRRRTCACSISKCRAPTVSRPPPRLREAAPGAVTDRHHVRAARLPASCRRRRCDRFRRQDPGSRTRRRGAARARRAARDRSDAGHRKSHQRRQSTHPRANARCCGRRCRVRRSRRSPHRCICRQVPSVTTCRRPSARRTRPPAPKPHASRANAAGSDRRDLSRIGTGANVDPCPFPHRTRSRPPPPSSPPISPPCRPTYRCGRRTSGPPRPTGPAAAGQQDGAEDRLCLAIAAGCHRLGENKVPEAKRKSESLARLGVDWAGHRASADQ